MMIFLCFHLYFNLIFQTHSKENRKITKIKKGNEIFNIFLHTHTHTQAHSQKY